MMIGIVIKVLSSVVTYHYPIFASYKCLKLKKIDDMEGWLVYWVVISVVASAESLFGFFFTWLPFYQLAKLGFISWLIMPHSQGAFYVYSTYIEPTLASHEKEIDGLMRSAQENIKTNAMYMFNRATEFVKEAVRKYATGVASSEDRYQGSSEAATSPSVAAEGDSSKVCDSFIPKCGICYWPHFYFRISYM
ncbi:TB2/DP1, HVA22 family-domain-containing protein [Dipodascopsis uninucleata]